METKDELAEIEDEKKIIEMYRAKQQRNQEEEKEPKDLMYWPDVDRNNEPRQNSIINAFEILKNDKLLKGAFKYNRFKRSIEIAKDLKGYPLYSEKGMFGNKNLNDVTNYISVKYNNNYKALTINSAIETESQIQGYDPVIDRINAKQWDGSKRLDTFFIDFLGAEDTLYTRSITRKWFCGAIARAYRPGIKFEMVPVLTGAQGIGKSSLLNAIFPEYHSGDLTSLDKSKPDMLSITHKNWIHELEEMVAYSKTGPRESKQFLSATEDEFRVAYGHRFDYLKRRCVFIGTNNDHEFLIDKTGNRRFFPIKCGMQNRNPKCNPFKVDDDYILQVLAEAKTMWDEGEAIFIDESDPDNEQLIKDVKAIQEGAMAGDEVEMIVDKYLDMQVPTNSNNKLDDWHNKTVYQKRQYWLRWAGFEETTEIADDNDAKEPEETRAIDFVSQTEIYDVAFNSDGKVKGTKNNNTIMRRITRILTQRGWGNSKGVAGLLSQKTMPNGSRPRGYMRPKK